MKKFLTPLFLLTLVFGNLFSASAFASTNDFYFSDATFDYYLSKASDGTAVLKTEEVLTAVFPTFDQDHGIERCIPFAYKNREALDVSSFSVTRNGVSEPFSTSRDGDYVCFRIGSASSYVHGSQVYKLSYTSKNVISEYSDSENQELYWDTNGTGWYQTFKKLTASVHLSSDIKDAWIGDKNCYVGHYGESGTFRCSFEETDDGVIFSTENLAPTENLSFDLGFKKGTFVIPDIPKDYTIVIFAGFIGVLFIVTFVLYSRSREKLSDKISLAKDKVVPVQYIAPREYTVAEMSENYLGTTKNSRVATLLELAVAHKIELEKGEKKVFGGYKWKIHVKDASGLTTEQSLVLQILNGGSAVHSGSVIEVKRRTATSTLERLSLSLDNSLKSSLENKHLFEKKMKGQKSATAPVLATTLISFFVIMFGGISLVATALDNSVGNLIGEDFFPLIIFALFAYVVLFTILGGLLEKYEKRSLEGIKMSKYLDGLKEYMTLAEKDRLKFLQSVDGADTSAKGIVKLYERLLPYAVLFGIEESWLSELSKYYEMSEVGNPNWMMGPTLFSSSDFRSFTTYTSSSIASSTASNSSGSSGGGGGGFSGGGGGGGGGGGW